MGVGGGAAVPAGSGVASAASRRQSLRSSGAARDSAASVSALVFAHPDASYFAVGKVQKDQVESYAKRKGMELEVCERWLSPILNYDR